MAIGNGVLAIGGAFILTLLLNAAALAAPQADGSTKGDAPQRIEKEARGDEREPLLDQVDAFRAQEEELSPRTNEGGVAACAPTNTNFPVGSPLRQYLLDQIGMLQHDTKDLSLRLAALEEAAVPRAEAGADSFSRLSIAVLGAATLLLALRVRKLK